MNHLERIAAHLGELDAVLLAGESNCYYATGFMGEGAALITRKGSWYFTDSRYTEAAEKAIGGAAVIGEISREKPFSALINDALAQTGAKNVGFEDESMTVAEHTAYTKKLSAALTPASALMTELRGSKDAEEIETMIAAQRIAEGALEQILKEIRPGMTEKAIAARLNYLMVSAGAEKTSFDTIIASGPNGSMPHAVPGMRQVREGDFITMDFGCVFGGYCSDMTRTVPVNGKFTPRQRAVYESVLNMMTYAKKILGPGILKSEYERLVRVFAAGELVKLGLITPSQVAEKPSDPPIVRKYYMHGCSHFLGLDVHDVGEANPVVLPGMVFTVEPGIYIAEEGIGIRLENDVLIGETENIDLLGDVPLLPDDIERLMAR